MLGKAADLASGFVREWMGNMLKSVASCLGKNGKTDVQPYPTPQRHVPTAARPFVLASYPKSSNGIAGICRGLCSAIRSWILGEKRAG